MKTKPKTPDEGPRIEMLPIADVRPRERNPRKHPREQIEALARSIREFGFTAPALIEADGTLIAGHGRVEAARKAGLERVPCLRVAHLTPEQVRAYVIADNRLAGLAEWDEQALKDELAALSEIKFDISAMGFTPEQLEAAIGKPETKENITIPVTFDVVAECKDETQQKMIYDLVIEKGIKCRLVTL